MCLLTSARQRAVVAGFLDIARNDNLTFAAQGTIVDHAPGGGHYIAPTLIAGLTPDHALAQDEIFGPVMAVMDFEDEAEVIARANDTEFGLSAGVFTRDLARGHRVIAQLEAGSCFINSYNDAPVEAPFGGSKNSGVGRENSKAAINYYSQLKSVYVRMGDVEAPF